MKAILPHLWFDKEAEEAAKLYTRLFDDSKITSTQLLEDTPSGDAKTVNFELAGQRFMAINGGPHFMFNPSISLMVLCETKEEVDRLWDVLVDGGNTLMPLDSYPFSKRYGWLEDRFGLTWQILQTDTSIAQKIVPHLLYSNNVAGKAEEAIRYYTEVFPHSAINELHHYQPGEEENPSGTIRLAGFRMAGMQFKAMDNARKADFTFNEAVSLLILCETQEEVDYYWDKLSAVPEAEQCGWLKDQFGVSWQVVPEQMDELLNTGTQEQINQVTKAFLKMKKLDGPELERIWHQSK